LPRLDAGADRGTVSGGRTDDPAALALRFLEADRGPGRAPSPTVSAGCTGRIAMSDEATLDELLSLWQAEKARGRDLPATVICRDRPEMAEELGRRIEAVRQMDDLAMQQAG